MGYTPEFLATKLIAIGYVTFIYFLLGMIIAKAFDFIYGEFDKTVYEPTISEGVKQAESRSLLFLAIEIMLHISFVGIIFYVMRNIVERIPFPLEGFGGYQHHRLKELEGGIVLEFVGVYFQKNLMKKTKYFMKRVFGADEGH